MSNESLINRIEVTLELVQTEQAPARALAESIRGNGRALECMPYNLIKELESMAMDLDIEQWHNEELRNGACSGSHSRSRLAVEVPP